VLQEYATRGGWRGVHDEGSLLRSLVFLLAWDVVFNDSVPGVFLSPYQDGPLDLDSSPQFYERRRDGIRALVGRIAAASRAELVAWVGSSFAANEGKSNRGAGWGSRGGWPLPLLQLAAVCVGGRSLAVVVDALLFDHKQRSGGLPDLFLWRVVAPSRGTAPDAAVAGPGATPSPGPDAASPGWLRLVRGAQYECRWCEVKGPRDRLADKQRDWLRVLLAAGCRTDLCRVQEPASSARGKRARLQDEAAAHSARL